jgi:hypothetical protein
MSVIAETEHARSEQLDNPESIYRACADMKLFSQEVLRVILLDTRYRHSSTVEITSLDDELVEGWQQYFSSKSTIRNLEKGACPRGICSIEHLWEWRRAQSCPTCALPRSHFAAPERFLRPPGS